MLNNKILTTCVIVLLAIAGFAKADSEPDTTFYGGLELSAINRTSYNDGMSSDLNNFKTSDTAGKLAIQKNEPGINAFIGARFNSFSGAEVGFGFIQQVSANVQNNLQATNKISNIYADLLGYLNIAQQVDLVGLIGVGGLKSKANVDGATFYSKSTLTATKVGIRLGGGVQYDFTDAWSSRAMIRFQEGNKQFLKSLISFSIGLLYTF